MAIEYSIRMKDKRLTEQILVNEINTLGYSSDRTERLPKGGIGIYLFEEAGFVVYLYDAGDYPYNCWETQWQFLERDFIAQKILSFRLDKFYPDLERLYYNILRIVCDLILELNEEALFIDSGGSEILLFREDNTIYANREEKGRSWFADNVKDFAGDRAVLYV